MFANYTLPWSHTDRIVANLLINGTDPDGEKADKRFLMPLFYFGVKASIYTSLALGAHKTLEKISAYEFLDKLV